MKKIPKHKQCILSVACAFLICIVAGCGSGGGDGGEERYNAVATVGEAGADYADPLAAMNDIASWCGTPSSANRCLLKILPGEYDIGTDFMQMLEYVDVEGAGSNETRISGSRDGVPGVVAGADNAEIRSITVENTGGGYYAFAMLSLDVSPKITNLSAVASGGVEQLGISCEGSCRAVMTNVTAKAYGGEAALGLYVDGAAPVMTNITALAYDSILNIGIDLNNFAAPVMENIAVTALRGSKTHALHFNGASTPDLTGVVATASGGTEENYALYNINASSPTMDDIRAVALGVKSYGVYTVNFGAFTGGTVIINNSSISGETGSIYAGATFAAMITDSRLEGQTGGPGSNVCENVYDEVNTLFSGPVCP